MGYNLEYWESRESNLKNFKLLDAFLVTCENEWRGERKKLIKNSAFKFSFFVVTSGESRDNWRYHDLSVLMGRMEHFFLRN